MQIVVGGGSGFIGRRLVNHLMTKGHDVTVISRSKAPGRITWSDIESRGLPAECDVVVNLAGENIMNPFRRWNPQFMSDLESSRIDTNLILSKAIIEAARKPSVFIATSAVGYYDPSSTAEYTEDSPPGSEYPATLCRKVEDSAKLSPDLNVRQSVVRVGLVLGREGGMIQNLYLPFSLGTGGRIASGKQWFPWIHADDVSGIFSHIIENENAEGVFNAVSPGISTNEEFTKLFASALCRPAVFPVPEFMLNLVFGDVRAKMMSSGQYVIPKRTLDARYSYRFPDLKTAVADCVK